MKPATTHPKTMPPNIAIRQLDPGDKGSIRQIAEWYFREWNTPRERTVQRLSNPSGEDTITQAILTFNGELIATGGLCNQVNIYHKHPELKKLNPWIALLYTQQEYRHQGLGQQLLASLEQCARDIRFNEIYLYTFSAEAFYKRNGWTAIERVRYKNHDTVVMVKRV